MPNVTELLCDLVRIPSVNPMGRPYQGDQFLEHAMTNYLETLFHQHQLECHRQTIAPRRENIVARFSGDPDRVLVLEAHQDTVPTDGMRIQPWTPQVVDGKVTGRGACDIKGGMACMLNALLRLANENPPGAPTVILACSVNEEYGFDGAREMAALWRKGEHPLVPRLPDAVVVAEPTELDVVVAHKGVVRWHCRTSGQACHSSVPTCGDNAIYRMARIVSALQAYADNEVAQLGNHPLLGAATLSVGRIDGGISVNTVPDECTIEIDRRVLPGEDPLAAREHAIEFVRHQLGDDPQIEHQPAYLATTGLSDAANKELARDLGAIARRHGGGQPIGVPYGTDAPAFEAIGVPTVVCGPGSIEQAHTCDEWVSIDQLEKASEVYYEWIRVR